LVDQASDVPNIISFSENLAKLFSKPFKFILLFSYKITKMKITFDSPKSVRYNEKKNTWKVKRLVDDSFAPSAHRTSVLYSRFRSHFIYYTGIKI